MSASSTETGVHIGIQKVHALLGQEDENSTRQSAKELGWVITLDKLQQCDHCAKAKAEQKNVAKCSTSSLNATKPGERVFLDLSKVIVVA